MLNQKSKHKDYVSAIKAEKRIEEIKAEIDRILKKLGQIEVGEP